MGMWKDYFSQRCCWRVVPRSPKCAGSMFGITKPPGKNKDFPFGKSISLLCSSLQYLAHTPADQTPPEWVEHHHPPHATYSIKEAGEVCPRSLWTRMFTVGVDGRGVSLLVGKGMTFLPQLISSSMNGARNGEELHVQWEGC